MGEEDIGDPERDVVVRGMGLEKAIARRSSRSRP